MTMPAERDHRSDERVSGRARTRSAQARRSPLSRAWWDRRQRLGGLAFVATTPRQAAADIVQAAIEGGVGEHVHPANAWSVALADTSPELAADAFSSHGWNLPDGRPISWISRLRGDRPALHQIRGPQLFLDVCELGLQPGARHYLIGGTSEVLLTLQEQLRRRFPGIRIVGAESPPFRIATADELAIRDSAIVESGAQIVWVGLGTPKQDVEAARLARAVPVIAIAVGAAFDFTAGSLREAPGWVTALGLEWAFRLVMEPRRLWRRYLIGNLRFLIAVLRPRRG